MSHRSHPLRVLFVLTLLSTALACGSPSSTPEGAGDLGGPAPDFQLSRLAVGDGGEAGTAGQVSRADLEGQVVLLDFWATWCGPCRVQAQVLHHVYPEYEDRVSFFAVNSAEELERVAAYVAKAPFPYPVLLDSEDRLGLAFGLTALPTVVIIDRDGKVAYLRQGISPAQTIKRELEAAGA